MMGVQTGRRSWVSWESCSWLLLPFLSIFILRDFFLTSLRFRSLEVLLQKEEFGVVLEDKSLWVIQTLIYPNTEAKDLLANWVPCGMAFGKDLLSILHCLYFYLVSLIITFLSQLGLLVSLQRCAFVFMSTGACIRGHIRERKGTDCLQSPAANEVGDN
jgi:hypothetical protein